MSIRLMSAAWDLDIPSNEKMVLLALCDFADDNGRNCWPSVETLAKRCSTSDRTVQRAIRALEQRGILKAGQRSGKSSEYRIDPRHIVRGDKKSGVTKTTKTPDTVSPKPPRTTNNKKKSAREIEVPLDFWPTPSPDSKTAKAMDAWPPGALETQVERFVAHHSARGTKFKDWQQAWTTWALSDFQKAGKPANDRQPRSTANAAEMARAKLSGSHH